MLYGWATGAFFPLFTTFAFGEVMAIIYITVFLRWTTKRTYALKATGVSFIVVALTALYTILGMTGATGQSRIQVGLITGYMMAMGCVLLYIAPFETIVRVLKTRSGASIPIGICLAGATSNSLWIVDGFLVGDTFIFILSIVCAAFALFQVVLYLVFRPTRQSAGVAHAEIRPIHTIQAKYVLPVTKVFSPKSDGTVESSPLSPGSAGMRSPSPVFVAINSP
ncbi:hypothetical protein BBJ28_00013965 [Nothophytophthora sp. Chile5]|nr:hypothetical protein BBJ28_00013965 [Nothophytophthora sp. Chile5]